MLDLSTPYINTTGGNGGATATVPMMQWNNQPIPYQTALRIGWNLPQDVVGSGVYGGIVSRNRETAEGKILIGKYKSKL